MGKTVAFLNLYAGTLVTDLGHLRVREVLVHNDALDEHGVLHPAADLGLHLDELEVNVLPLDVGHRKNRAHCNLGHLTVALVDTGGGVEEEIVKK